MADHIVQLDFHVSASGAQGSVRSGLGDKVEQEDIQADQSGQALKPTALLILSKDVLHRAEEYVIHKADIFQLVFVGYVPGGDMFRSDILRIGNSKRHKRVVIVSIWVSICGDIGVYKCDNYRDGEDCIEHKAVERDTDRGFFGAIVGSVCGVRVAV